MSTMMSAYTIKQHNCLNTHELLLQRYDFYLSARIEIIRMIQLTYTVIS